MSTTTISMQQPHLGNHTYAALGSQLCQDQEGGVSRHSVLSNSEYLAPAAGFIMHREPTAGMLDRTIAPSQTELAIELSSTGFQKAIGQPFNMSKLPNVI
jgi:hypothetical protein